MSIYRGSI